MRYICILREVLDSRRTSVKMSRKAEALRMLFCFVIAAGVEHLTIPSLCQSRNPYLVIFIIHREWRQGVPSTLSSKYGHTMKMHEMKTAAIGIISPRTHHHHIIRFLSLRSSPWKKNRKESLTANRVVDSRTSVADWIFRLLSKRLMKSGVMAVVLGSTFCCTYRYGMSM